MKSMMKALFCVLSLFALSTAASADTRVPFTPYSILTADPFLDVTSNYNHIPSSGTVSGIQTRTIEAGEATHACRNVTPSAGTHSIWFSINFAGGTLNIDTQGSNYNTVMSIYKPAGTFASLTAVACSDDDIPAVDLTARISTVLPEGTYFVQISRYETAPTGAALTLSVALSAVYPVSAPNNDSFANAKPVYLNQTVTVKNAQYATEETAEPNRTCGAAQPSHSVWFSIAVPTASTFQVTLSTENSALNYGAITSTDTVMDIFTGASLGTLTPAKCSDDAVVNYAAMVGQELSTNTTVYIRVSAYNSINLLSGSQFKLKITLGALVSLNADESFEQIPQTVWTLKNASGDGQVCGLNLALGDDCVMRFVGGPGEKSSVKQSFTLPSVLKVRKDHMILMAAQYKATDPATNFTISLEINYTDGTPKTIIKKKIGNYSAIGYRKRRKCVIKEAWTRHGKHSSTPSLRNSGKSSSD